MSGTWVGVTAGLGYVIGYLITATIMAVYSFREFDKDWEGVAWAMFGAIIWPVFALFFVPALIVRWAAGRIA